MENSSELDPSPSDEQDASNLGHSIDVSMHLLHTINWYSNTMFSTTSDEEGLKLFQDFAHQMERFSVIERADYFMSFIRISLQNVMIRCHNIMMIKYSNHLYHVDVVVNKFVKLVVHIIEYHNGNELQVMFLAQLMDVLTKMLLAESVSITNMNAYVPYCLMIQKLLFELSAPNRGFETFHYKFLAEFCSMFHHTRPSKCSSFVYVWLPLITNRSFMSGLLKFVPKDEGWRMFAQLLIDFFDFMAPFLSFPVQRSPLKLLCTGTLRVLVLLIHDFPEFLCEYWFYFINIIPNCCAQMRNLILSSYPCSIEIPGPFSCDWRIDSLPEIRESPKISVDFNLFIQPKEFKNNLCKYLSAGTPIGFRIHLLANLKSSPDLGRNYNVSSINAVVLYAGVYEIAHMKDKSLLFDREFYMNSTHMSLLKFLSATMCNEGRYLLYSAIVNNLRFPNSYTAYFKNVLLYLFETADCDMQKEQIVRVLLERVIAIYPHPWGLIVTLLELLNNPKYSLMELPFTQCDPTLQELFEYFIDSCDNVMVVRKSVKGAQYP